MKKYLAAFALIALTTSAFAEDEPYSFKVEIGTWNHGFDGYYSAGPDNVDLKHEDESQGVVGFEITHQLPLIPNLKLRHTEIDTTGGGTASTQIIFGDQTFTAGTDLNSVIDIRYSDVILFYRVIDTFFQVDVGITTKLIDGEIKLSSTTNSRLERFASPVTMGYVGFQLNTPVDGLSLSANGSLLDLGTHNISDYSAQVSYEHASGFGANLGYRAINLEVDGLDGVDADATIDGAYLNLSYAM